MTHVKLKKKLSLSGIDLSDNQIGQIEALIHSGKMDFHLIKKCLLPEFPKHLINTSLNVMGDIEVDL